MTSRRLSATPVLLAAMALAAAYVVTLGSKLSFLLDDWGYIVLRRGSDFEDWSGPTTSTSSPARSTIWKLLIAVFGIDSMLPFSSSRRRSSWSASGSSTSGPGAGSASGWR